MNLKHELDMIKFAFENGHTKMERIVQPNNDIAYVGAWGTFILTDNYEIIAMDSVINYMLEELIKQNEVTEEIQVVETTEVFENSNEIIDSFDLTEKEAKVLKAIVHLSESEEFGLPVWNEEVQKYSGIKGKSYSGVISSLFNKGYIETYLDNLDPSVQNEYHLTEEMYIKLIDPDYSSY